MIAYMGLLLLFQSRRKGILHQKNLYTCSARLLDILSYQNKAVNLHCYFQNLYVFYFILRFSLGQE